VHVANGTISFETFIETMNSCCVPRFPLIASCYKIHDSQTSFTLCQGVEDENFGKVGVGVSIGNFGKVGVGNRHFTSDSATLLATLTVVSLTCSC